MTEYNLRLAPKPFEAFKQGRKSIEMRLNDERRRGLKVGDVLTFYLRDDNSNFFSALITNIYPHHDFEELYSHHSKLLLGYDEDDEAKPSDMEQYYTKEQIAKYGVLGIELTILEITNGGHKIIIEL